MKKLKTKTPYDKSAVFNRDLLPLLKEIRDVCLENEIPCICSFAVKTEVSGSTITGFKVRGPDRFVPAQFMLAALLLSGNVEIADGASLKHLIQNMIADSAASEFNQNN
jgi:hypothetical protein